MNQTNISQWIGKEDKEQQKFRQAIHAILTAISLKKTLHEVMILKGGVLLAIGYGSTRFTRDVDFSTATHPGEFDCDKFLADFKEGLALAVERLGYGIDCRVQSCKKQPPREEADFPTIQLTIGYADRSERRSHQRLMAGNSSQIVRVDYSLNEPEGSPEVLVLEDDKSGQSAIRTYSLKDLVAEKFRALLQQEVRNRTRRQDIYDLYFLLIDKKKMWCGDYQRLNILKSIIEKSSSRNLAVNKYSMRNKVIKEKTQIEYNALEKEIEGTLPDFEEAYEMVQQFYESLPWANETAPSQP